MKTKSLKLLLLLMATAGLSLACVINLGGPTPEGPAIPISENSADEIQTTIDTARELASSGDPVTFGLSEGQATSLLAIELQKKEDPLLRNPQVYLEDGYVEVYGQAQRGVLAGNLHLTLEIYADDEGNPAFKITQADFGPLPLPEGLLDSLSSIFDEAFTGKLGPLATGIRIDKISVDNGWMEITGRLR